MTFSNIFNDFALGERKHEEISNTHYCNWMFPMYFVWPCYHRGKRKSLSDDESFIKQHFHITSKPYRS